MMVHFENDYITGAHPAVLEALMQSNMQALSGYGADCFTEAAKEKIAALCGGDVEVELLAGGTQTNAVVISTLLRDYEGVIAADTAHIATHEAGAIEYSGSKVITLPQTEGKISISALKAYLERFYADENREHMVFPGMVYISLPTEYGTVYSLSELEQIAAVCRQYNLRLFADGARLGYALMSEEADFTLKQLSDICDVFYLGGTKNGALCGEAVVFKKGVKPAHWLTSVKKRGALLAKGRLCGVQFSALFENGLYFEIAKKANEKARALEQILLRHNVPLYLKSSTNQVFAVLEKAQVEQLNNKVGYSFWERVDAQRIVGRFATCWSTSTEDLERLEAVLLSLEK